MTRKPLPAAYPLTPALPEIECVVQHLPEPDYRTIPEVQVLRQGRRRYVLLRAARHEAAEVTPVFPADDDTPDVEFGLPLAYANVELLVFVFIYPVAVHDAPRPAGPMARKALVSALVGEA